MTQEVGTERLREPAKPIELPSGIFEMLRADIFWAGVKAGKNAASPLPPPADEAEIIGPELLEALDLVEDITARADAMKLGLVAYPVSEIKRLAAAIRNLRSQK